MFEKIFEYVLVLPRNVKNKEEDLFKFCGLLII